MERRTFLKVSGVTMTGLFIGCDSDSADRHAKDQTPKSGTAPERTVNTWLGISPDNQITVLIHKAEMGQGISTAIAMIVAEELEADWSRIGIRLIGETEPTYTLEGSIKMTASSSSIRTQYQPLRKVGAAAKEMLLQACANQWQVQVSSLTAKNSEISHPTHGSLTYGALALEAAKLPVPENPTLKDPKNFSLIGQSLGRLDAVEMLRGTCVFGTDTVVPDMLYGAPRLSPVVGGKAKNVDTLRTDPTEATAVVEVPDGLVVVSDSHWKAWRVAQQLDVEFEWPEDAKDIQSDVLIQQVVESLEQEGTQIGEPDGNFAKAWEESATRVEATYQVPLLAHAAMEPMSCTAHVVGDELFLWAPTQSARGAQRNMAELLDIPPGNVHVAVTYLGGGFGRKADTDCMAQAVLASKAVGRPVKVVWTRDVDTQHDHFRPIFASRMQAGLDADGHVTCWRAKNAGTSVLNLGPRDPLSIYGFQNFPYSIPNKEISHVSVPSPVKVGFWRSIGMSQNIFFVESFIDELAHAAANTDPLTFRRLLLRGNERYLRVLHRLAEISNWYGHDASVTKGMAILDMHDSAIALAVDVVMDNGKVHVPKTYCVVDCGRVVVNPRNVEAQMQGGIVFGLSAALAGEITIVNGRVQQSNFQDYPIQTMADAPETIVEVMTSPDCGKIGGIGEGGVPPVAPAVANAIFRATGQRIRRPPFHGVELS